MTAIQTPAADAPAAEWGALAVSIPGWRWMPGMYAVASSGSTRVTSIIPRWWLQTHDAVPDPDDPATAGCLLAMLGPYVNVIVREHTTVVRILPNDPPADEPQGDSTRGSGATLGRACIAAAAALGRWPGGAS